MKADLHPEYKATTIKCVCGNEVKTGSTKDGLTVDICAKCHPFFTGKQKFVDTGGRIDKFNKRLDAAEGTVNITPPKKEASVKVEEPKAEVQIVEEPKTEEVAQQAPVAEEPQEEVAETPAEEVQEETTEE